MLPLDVPFTPDPDYIRFLTHRRDTLCSVHFSIHDPGLSDARQLMERQNADRILSGLNELGSIPKYALMNGRLHAPDKYFSETALSATGHILNTLVEQGNINGLIFSDAYYLQALSDAHPGLAEKLEAGPSVNTMLDSSSRAFALLDMIEQTRFKPPTRLVLDRSLNRNMERLEKTARRIRSVYPKMKLHLIANEGCLYQCPYKPAHDAHIALVNEGLCGERTFAMNRDFGCIRRLLTDKGAMLASPFIRPEDISQYEGLIDGIKLCGRNRGTPFLARAITAYREKRYSGNLLDLMDAMGDLSDRVNLPNDQIPEDFLNRVTTCNKACIQCGWCVNVAQQIMTRTDPGLG